jgi:hypothetical protein
MTRDTADSEREQDGLPGRYDATASSFSRCIKHIRELYSAASEQAPCSSWGGTLSPPDMIANQVADEVGRNA